MALRFPAVFRHRNYRLFFFGQMVSLMGTFMQAVALGWLVYRLTNSPFLLGLVTFVSQAPLFFVSPFAGPLADRFNRRTVFVITQALAMLQAGVLTVLTFTGFVKMRLNATLPSFVNPAALNALSDAALRSPTNAITRGADALARRRLAS